jgi:hypothetical protein
MLYNNEARKTILSETVLILKDKGTPDLQFIFSSLCPCTVPLNTTVPLKTFVYDKETLMLLSFTEYCRCMFFGG